MDKVEYKIRTDEIKRLIAEGDYAHAAEIADTIDWRRVKSVMMLCTISDLYKINRRYEDARDILLLAYERRPGGRTICYSLCELSLKTDEYVQAYEYYKEFLRVAPSDPGRFILQYKIYEAQETSLEERIEVLEELKKRDYREKWAYELAYLYHRVGLATRCVEECDELILWFGEGKYVIKAMELKMLHQPLTPQQQEQYDHRFEVYEGAAQSGEYGEGEAAADGASEGENPYAQEPDSAEEQLAAQSTKVFSAEEMNSLVQALQKEKDSAPAEPIEEELPDFHVKTMDMGRFNTMNLQAELATNLREVLEKNEEPEQVQPAVSGKQAPDFDVETESLDALEMEEVGEEELEFDEEEMEGSEVFFGETVEIGDLEQDIQTQAMTEQPPKELAGVLSQESDGQISFVLPESNKLEKQITGQMSIEDILVEWERLKKENQEKRKQEVRKHVLAHTGEMFTEFEAAARDGLLEKLQKDEGIVEETQNSFRKQEPAPEAVSGKIISQKAVSQKAISEADGSQETDYQETAYGNTVLSERKAAEYEENAALEEAYRRYETGEFTAIDGGIYDEAGAWEEGAESYHEAGAWEEGGESYGEAGAWEEGAEPYGEAGAWEEGAESYGEAGAWEEGAESYGEAGAWEEGAEPYHEAGAWEEGAEPYNEAGAWEEGAEPYGEAGAWEEGAESYGEAGAWEEDGESYGEIPERYAGTESGYDAYAEYEEAEDEAAYQEEQGAIEEANPLKEQGEAEEPSPLKEQGEIGEPNPLKEQGEIEESNPSEDEEEPEEPERMDGQDDAEDQSENILWETALAEASRLDPPKVQDFAENIPKKQLETDRSRIEIPDKPRTDVILTKEFLEDEEEIPQEREKLRSLTREEKELYAPYIQNRSSKEQLIRAIDNISMASYTGNLVITGEEGMDTLTLAKNVIREIQASDSNFSGKVAKISGENLNKRDVAGTLEDLKNGALIIEKTSELNDAAVQKLYQTLQRENMGIVVILEDTKKRMNRFLNRNEKLANMFTARIDVEALSNDSLVAFGRQYAKELEYSIDDLGILALHTKIESLQTSDHVVTVLEVKGIVDDAIGHARKKTLGHFFDILVSKRYDEEDMIILSEKDFV